MVRLFGYTRVSTYGQADNTSLEVQEIKIRNYCKAYGYELLEVFKEVKTGKESKNRIIFQGMLSRLDEVDGVIVVKMDRIARNLRDFLNIQHDHFDNKTFISMDIGDTKTKGGKMLMGILGTVADCEWDDIREKTQGGRKHKHEQGGYAYGTPPYGKISINKNLVPCGDEIKTIEMIKSHYEQGDSLRAIAKTLNREGVPTKRAFKNPNYQWQAIQVRNILIREGVLIRERLKK